MGNKIEQVSDYEVLRERVFDHIRSNNLLNEDNVLVDSEGSEIILYGDVTSEENKVLAEDLALSVPGVLHITNRLHVIHN